MYYWNLAYPKREADKLIKHFDLDITETRASDARHIYIY